MDSEFHIDEYLLLKPGLESHFKASDEGVLTGKLVNIVTEHESFLSY